MRKSSTLLPFLLCISLLLTCFGRVKAATPLPSSFYGTVKVNGENVPEGTIIRAIINGQVVATTQAILYQGETFYDIEVPADDPSTTAIEGGQESDVIRFMLAGFLVRETATWQSGTDTEFNLSLTANATLQPPQPTETPTPTQTPLPMPTQTPTILPTQTTVTQPTRTAITQPTQTDITQPTQTDITQPTQTPITQPTQYPITQPTQYPITQPTQTLTTGQTPELTATLPTTRPTSEFPLDTDEAFVPFEETETIQPTVTEVDQPTAEDDPQTQTESNQESRGMGFVIPSIIFVIMVAIAATIYWAIRKNRKEDSGLLL